MARNYKVVNKIAKKVNQIFSCVGHVEIQPNSNVATGQAKFTIITDHILMSNKV